MIWRWSLGNFKTIEYFPSKPFECYHLLAWLYSHFWLYFTHIYIYHFIWWKWSTLIYGLTKWCLGDRENTDTYWYYWRIAIFLLHNPFIWMHIHYVLSTVFYFKEGDRGFWPSWLCGQIDETLFCFILSLSITLVHNGNMLLNKQLPHLAT